MPDLKTLHSPASSDRQRLKRMRDELRRWDGRVSRLLQAFDPAVDLPHVLPAQLESLRNKRDTALTKLVAVQHHPERRWPSLIPELEEALASLRSAWRTAIGTLYRERATV